jgi:uncharacterized protein
MKPSLMTSDSLSVPTLPFAAPPTGPKAAGRVRRLRLPFPNEIDPMIFAGQPEESFMTVGTSLVLPYVEPYLVRSMNQARRRVTDPKLLRDMALLTGQESQHHREHVRFNRALRVDPSAKLEALEAELCEEYRRFSEQRSLRFNVAYADAVEAYSMAVARFFFECKVATRLEPPVRELFEWHLLEELEHRGVASDVYAHVCGGYVYRLIVGLYAQWHLLRFVTRAAALMRKAYPASARAEWGGPLAAWRRTRPRLWLALRGLVPKLLATYSPWYTPRDVEVPPDVLALAARYDQTAARRGTMHRATPIVDA